jgi:hypothetical protein
MCGRIYFACYLFRNFYFRNMWLTNMWKFYHNSCCSFSLCSSQGSHSQYAG